MANEFSNKNVDVNLVKYKIECAQDLISLGNFSSFVTF